jgi:hypothetical protein
MSEFFIKAKSDRRRGGVRFNKGMNGPFKADDFTKEQAEAIEADPFLEPSEADSSSEGKSKSRTSGSARRSGKSAAQKRAEKRAADEQAKTDAHIAKVADAIKTLPEGTLPTVESVSAAMKAAVTEEELKLALEANT